MDLRRMLLVASLATSGGAGVAAAQTCVALGYGGWVPETPTWLPSPWFETPPHVRLLTTPVREPRRSHVRGWKTVGAAPILRSDTVWTDHTPEGEAYEFNIGDVFGGWRAPQPDSLELRRLAGLTWEIEIVGRWDGDTLRGRAHTYTDVRSLAGEPRANAYGIRYPCHDRRSGAAAARALLRLRNRDRPDTALARRDAQREQRVLDSLLREVRALRRGP